MGKTIKNNADKAFSYATGAERRAYIKGYEEALQDMKRHLDIAAIAGKSFMVLDMYKWIDRRFGD